MDKNHAAKLLAHGLRTSEVARALGVTDARVSELRNDPTFLDLVAQQTKAIVARELNRKESYDELEDSILDTLKTRVHFGDIPELTRLLETLVEIKRPAAVQQTHSIGTVVVVNQAFDANKLNRPTTTMNNKGEVIAIGGRSLAPMSSTELEKLVTRRDTELVEGVG